MSEPRTHDQITKILMKEFPKEAIKQRQGGGGKRLSYVEGHAVIHRLIDATDNQFDVRVLDLNITGDMARATVELTIPGLGTRQHIGVQRTNEKAEDLVKGAITDALKKAATLFGVGLELYGEDYEAGQPEPEQASKATPKTAKQAAPATSPEEQDVGKQRLAEVEAILAEYPNWSLNDATTWLRQNGLTRWSALEFRTVEALHDYIDDHPDGPPATPERNTNDTSTDYDWSARIEAATSTEALSKIANGMLKAGIKDKADPRRKRLNERMANLREAVPV